VDERRVCSVIEPTLLKSLSEQYARRAREFSDSVALLGRYNSCGLETLKLFKKIKRQRELCGDAEEKLERYIRQDIEDPEAARLNDQHRSKPLTFTWRLH
jgi:hypothetical protein